MDELREGIRKIVHQDYQRSMTQTDQNIVKGQVTAIIVTYSPDEAVLRECIDSLQAQSPKPSIIIADNFSPSDPSHKVALSFESENVRVISFDRNCGFGGAINRALKLVKSRFTLISNYDIIYDREYLSSAINALESSGNEVIGIAGKTLFYPPSDDKDWPGTGPLSSLGTSGLGTGGVIDNTGTLVNGLMLAYNRGVGQIDIGQYDKSDRVMGACFAAFLVRTDAFKPVSQGGVGILDESFFMYYEDIDWCYRANLLGFQILYEPKAVAWHHHSLTTRNKSLFFKYHLIQRNLYRTIIKNMRFRTFIKLWLLHARLHIRRAKIEPQFRPVTIRILLETLLWLPIGLCRRQILQFRRKVSDTDIVNLSIGEEGYLDDVLLRPQIKWANPLASLERLEKNFPEAPARSLIPLIKKAASGEGASEDMQELLKLTHERCPALVRLVRQIHEEYTDKH